MEFENLISYTFRWIHMFAGVIWIGLLYYFNFVQTEYFKETSPEGKSAAISKLVPRALWWFRYGALFTFLSGTILAAYLGGAINYYITLGMIMGTLMFLNVWLIIWPNQKIVIASNEQVLGGGEALPDAASALGKAGLASRTNTLFSLPMLFFMGWGVFSTWKNYDHLLPNHFHISNGTNRLEIEMHFYHHVNW